jgi:transcription elongation factor GreA
MLRTAHVIEVRSDPDSVSLFDSVLIRNEKIGQERRIQIVTTLRQNALEGYISKESPLGSALLGHKVGDRILVEVNATMSYYVTILEIKKGEDNADLPISGY